MRNFSRLNRDKITAAVAVPTIAAVTSTALTACSAGGKDNYLATYNTDGTMQLTVEGPDGGMGDIRYKCLFGALVSSGTVTYDTGEVDHYKGMSPFDPACKDGILTPEDFPTLTTYTIKATDAGPRYAE